MLYNEEKSYSGKVSTMTASLKPLSPYHNTKTQAEGSGEESVALCDRELLHARELADNNIDAYYAGSENASHAADAGHHPSPGIVIESHVGGGLMQLAEHGEGNEGDASLSMHNGDVGTDNAVGGTRGTKDRSWCNMVESEA